MTDKIEIGDRVRVEFEGEVAWGGNDWIDVESSNGVIPVPKEFATRIAPELPTEIGSVIQITYWAGRELSGPEWRAVLTGGGWAVAIDNDPQYTPAEFFSEGDPRFKVLL